MTIRGSPPALWHSLLLAEGLVWLQNDGDYRIQKINTMTHPLEAAPPPAAAAPPTQPNDHQGVVPPLPLAQPVAGGGAGLARTPPPRIARRSVAISKATRLLSAAAR